jgi:hypothetical protein
VNLLEILLHPRMLGAALAYAVLTPLLLYLGHRLLDRVEDVPVTGWLAEHVALPMLRVIAMLGFLAMAYPVIFGVEGLPPLSDVLSGAPGRVTTLINLLFVLSVVLAALPLIGDVQALVLPVQAIAACALLITWSAGPGIGVWPAWEVLGSIVLWAGLTYAAGSWLLHRLGTYIDGRWQIEGAQVLLLDTLMLIFQLPAILIYALALGRRLTGA